MHYESSTNDQKFNVDISDGIYQYSSMPQLAEINHTRTLLLRLTFIEFVLSIICMVIVIYSFIFGDTWGFESYSIVLRFLPLLSFMCFGFGLIVADRYHVKGLCVCHFLPDINNERETHNKIYCTNMLKLNAFVITYLDLDEIIIPKQSG
ncbi:unnamed protein product [Rotaria sordida]|uniref:Uncharacterized protein n=1 Tax=Rotaria sordida TaxID=392033 RepID=A0A819LT46_9BILA|nr:unnamed protein product [Rotaria sordida]